MTQKPHLIAACIAGMGTDILACVLKQRGHEIIGSENVLRIHRYEIKTGYPHPVKRRTDELY